MHPKGPGHYYRMSLNESILVIGGNRECVERNFDDW
jgi:hypothetical protein